MFRDPEPIYYYFRVQYQNTKIGNCISLHKQWIQNKKIIWFIIATKNTIFKNKFNQRCRGPVQKRIRSCLMELKT